MEAESGLHYRLRRLRSRRRHLGSHHPGDRCPQQHPRPETRPRAPRLQATRARIRNNPNTEDAVDSALIPSPLRIAESKGDSPVDLMIAAMTRHIKVSGTTDTAHSDGKPFDTSRAFVYVAGAPALKGFLVGKDRTIKILSTYKDDMASPQSVQLANVIDKEKYSLKKHEVHNVVPITNVTKERT